MLMRYEDIDALIDSILEQPEQIAQLNKEIEWQGVVRPGDWALVKPMGDNALATLVEVQEQEEIAGRLGAEFLLVRGFTQSHPECGNMMGVVHRSVLLGLVEPKQGRELAKALVTHAKTIQDLIAQFKRVLQDTQRVTELRTGTAVEIFEEQRNEVLH